MSKLTKALVGTALSSGLISVVTFISGILLARTLGPELRGIYGSIVVVAQTVCALSTLSFFDAWIIRHSEDGNDAASSLASLLAVSLGVALVVLMGSLAAYGFGLFNGPHAIHYAAFIPTLVFITLISESYMAIERARLNFAIINIYRISNPVFFCLFLLLGFYLVGATSSYCLAATAAASGLFLFYWIYKFRKNVFQPVDVDLIYRSLVLGLKFHIAFAVNAVAGQIDRLLLIAVWPAAMLGNYFVAYSAVGAGYSLVSSALSITLFPVLVNIHGPERRDKIHQLIRCAIVILIATSIPLAIVLPFLIPIVFGQKFQQAALMAVGLVVPMALTPLRTIVTEAIRSRGGWRPSAEMAITSLLVFAGSYSITHFSSSIILFTTMTVATLAAIAVGARYMVRNGDLRLGRGLVPTIADVRFLADRLIMAFVRS